MARSKQQLIDEYRQFRKAVDDYREGSNKPDPQLRAVYDQWIKDSAEWDDARAAFSLYCRLNRLLHSDFVNHLFEYAREKGISLFGDGAEFREKDTIEVIGGWLLTGAFPSKVDLQFQNKEGGSGTIQLMVIKRADDGRYMLYNAQDEVAIDGLCSLLSRDS